MKRRKLQTDEILKEYAAGLNDEGELARFGLSNYKEGIKKSFYIDPHTVEAERYNYYY